MTDAGEAERKESSGRTGPVGDVGVDYSDADDTHDDGEIDRGKHEVDSRRYLDTSTDKRKIIRRSATLLADRRDVCDDRLH